MNTPSIDFQSFVEWDNSPFVLFDHTGRIIYLNKAAEVLFGYATTKEIYDLALENAPHSFGYKTTPLKFSYNTLKFYALTVGYEDEEQISIRLYHEPRDRSASIVETEKLIETDINVLLEASIALFKIKNSNKLRLLTDQDIPLFKIDQNNFSKLLRKSFDAFKASAAIEIELKFHLGEHMIINNKKEQIIQLSIKANGRYTDADSDIRELSESCHVIPILQENSIILDIPLLR